MCERTERAEIEIENQPQAGREDPTKGPPPAGDWGVRFFRSRWFPWASWGLAALALGYVVSRLRWSELRLSGITWWLVILALLLQIGPRLLEAGRWQYLLRPLRLHFWLLLQAVYIGDLVSGVLPLAGGDVVRAAIIAARARVHVVRVLFTELVERVCDAVAIICVVWFTLRGLVPTRAWRLALTGLEIAVVLAVLFSAVLVAENARIGRRLEGWRVSAKASGLFKSVAAEGVRAAALLTGRALAVCLAAALAATVVNIGSLWCLLHAYHLSLTFSDAAAILVLIVIGTFLPGTPGNLGSWQFFCVVGLRLFGVSAARAAGFSLVGFVFWTLPPVLVGFFALFSSPFSWSELRRYSGTGAGPVAGQSQP